MTRGATAIALIVLVSGCGGLPFGAGTPTTPSESPAPEALTDGSVTPPSSTPGEDRSPVTINATEITGETDPWTADDATATLVREVAFLDPHAARLLGERVVMLGEGTDTLTRLQDTEENARFVEANGTYYSNLSITTVDPVVYELRLTETSAPEANRSVTPFESLPPSTRTVVEDAIEHDEIVHDEGTELRDESVETYYSYESSSASFYLSPEHYENETFGTTVSNRTHVRYDGTTYRVEANLFLPGNEYAVARIDEDDVNQSATPVRELSPIQQRAVREGIIDGEITTFGGRLFENGSRRIVERDGEYYRIGHHTHYDHVAYLLAVNASRVQREGVLDRYGIVEASSLDESVREPLVNAARSGEHTVADGAPVAEVRRLLEDYDFLHWNGSIYRVRTTG